MRHRSVFSLTLAALSAALGFSGAQAGVVIPAAFGSVTCGSGLVGGTIKVDSGPTSCHTQFAEGSRTPAPNPEVVGAVLVDPAYYPWQASVEGTLIYSLEVIGGKPGTLVPLKVDFSLYADPDGGGAVYSSIQVATIGTAKSYGICNSSYYFPYSNCHSGETKVDGSFGVKAYSGTVYTDAVDIFANVYVYLGTFGVANGGLVRADPHIYVDPSFPDAGDYTVVLSPGVGNSLPGVPEPATWAMMILGVAGIGTGARRRAPYPALFPQAGRGTNRATSPPSSSTPARPSLPARSPV